LLYLKLFTSLQQPKDDSINILVFVLGYAINQVFIEHFPKQENWFDLRFIFDCIHIILHEFNGLYVSDNFIKLNIERIFNQRFMNFEMKESNKIVQKKNSERESFFMSKLKTSGGSELQMKTETV
jgi:hypothetical protein